MKIAYILCLLLIATFIPFFLEGSETLQFVPDSCFSVVTISNVQGDKGVNWLINAWINSPRESPLRDLLSAVPAQEISVALFTTGKSGKFDMLVIVNMPKGEKVDKILLDNLIETASGTKMLTTLHKKSTITYTMDEEAGDFAAYSVVKNNIIVSATLNILKTALDGSSIEKSDTYNEIQSVLAGNQDGQLITDNSNSQFVQFLRPMEENWGMSLLLSADYLQWMGATFDFIDSQRVSGNFVFHGIDNLHIEDIYDDAEFVGETFKRKFIADKIDYQSDVTVSSQTVILEFEMGGLESLWNKLFEKGVHSLFSIEPE